MTHPSIIADSGPLGSSTSYTTVVLFHGYGWTSGEFLSRHVRSDKPPLRSGMDAILMDTGISVAAFQGPREAALRCPRAKGMGPGVGRWDSVEVRHVWGDHSVASMVFAMRSLRSELGRKAGKRLRDVSFVRVVGGNHLVSPVSRWCGTSPNAPLKVFFNCNAAVRSSCCGQRCSIVQLVDASITFSHPHLLQIQICEQ